VKCTLKKLFVTTLFLMPHRKPPQGGARGTGGPQAQSSSPPAPPTHHPAPTTPSSRSASDATRTTVHPHRGARAPGGGRDDPVARAAEIDILNVCTCGSNAAEPLSRPPPLSPPSPPRARSIIIAHMLFQRHPVWSSSTSWMEITCSWGGGGGRGREGWRGGHLEEHGAAVCTDFFFFVLSWHTMS